MGEGSTVSILFYATFGSIAYSESVLVRSAFSTIKREVRYVNLSAAIPEATVARDYCLLIRLTESFNVGKRQISSRLIPCKSFGGFHR